MKIYHYYKDNNEFYQIEEYNKIEGIGLPGYSTGIKPLPEKEGFVSVFDEKEQKWNYVEDNRHKDIYIKETGEQVRLNIIGPIPVMYTELAPTSEFDVWKEDQWVRSEEKKREVEKQESRKTIFEYRTIANAHINAILALKHNRMATVKEVGHLHVLYKYMALMMRLELIGGNNIPEPPLYPSVSDKDKLYKESWLKRVFKK